MTTLMTRTPATGLSYVAVAQSCTTPKTAGHETSVSFAGTLAAAQVAVLGARNIDLPGSPSRGAPV